MTDRPSFTSKSQPTPSWLSHESLCTVTSSFSAIALRPPTPAFTKNPDVSLGYLKLIDQNRVRWQNRAHFFAVTARAMRRILIDHANARMAQKRGGGAAMATLHDDDVVREARAEELVDLDEALTRLEALDQRQARIVEMSFFGTDPPRDRRGAGSVPIDSGPGLAARPRLAEP